MKQLVSLILIVFTISAADAEDPATFFAGVWHDSPIFAEQTCYGLILLLPDGRFFLNNCLEECTVQSQEGQWSVEPSSLVLQIEWSYLFKGENDPDDWGCLFSESPISEDNRRRIVRLPRGPVTEQLPPTGEPLIQWKVNLAGRDYWKVELNNTDLSDYCDPVFSCQPGELE